jgi:hypothetical protein
MAAITYLTKDDPPAMLQYNLPNEKVTAATSLGTIVHHPLFGIALKREMDRLGIDCVVQYKGDQPGEMIQEPPASGNRLVSPVDFIRRNFAAVR